MRKISITKIFTIITILLFAISCSNKPQFTIEGKIEGANDSTTIYLSKRTMTETTVIDSTKISNDGSFTLKSPAPEYPDFYLLTLDGQNINIAIDSIETIKIETTKKNFSSDYIIEGSASSMYIKDIVTAQNELHSAIKKYLDQENSKELSSTQLYEDINKAIKDYKDIAFKVILKDSTGMAGYFAIFQKIDGYLIFDPNEKSDLRAYQAVATRWDKSQSPRAEHVKQFTLASLASIRKIENNANSINELLTKGVTDQNKYYNIVLPDIKNQEVDLSSLKGKIVILDFTSYAADFSPAHSIELNTIYEKNKSQIEIYQVSLDSDIHTWRNSAANLPWICVRDDQGVNSPLLLKFNIQDLPTTFIIDREGEIQIRIMPNQDLEAELKKIL